MGVAPLSGEYRQPDQEPDEVVIVPKPSGGGSEEVISSFSTQLPIELVVQERGTSQTRCR